MEENITRGMLRKFHPDQTEFCVKQAQLHTEDLLLADFPTVSQSARLL